MVAGATAALIVGGGVAPSGASAQEPCPTPLLGCVEHVYDYWLTGPCAGPCWPGDLREEACEAIWGQPCNLPLP